MRLAALFVSVLFASSALAQGAQVINLLEFKTSDPNAFEQVRRNTASLPLTLAELQKMQAGGIGEPTLIDMVRTRRVMMVADADGLIALKKSGASDAMVGAVSQHAWPPNEGFDLTVQLDVASPGGMTRPPYLYIEVWHEGLQRQEALMFADLRTMLTRGLKTQVRRDRSDPTLPLSVASVTVTGKIRTRQAGTLTIRALVSQQPGLRSLRDAPKRWANQIKTWKMDYPAVSLDARCRVRLGLERDISLKDLYVVRRDDFECRWN